VCYSSDQESNLNRIAFDTFCSKLRSESSFAPNLTSWLLTKAVLDSAPTHGVVDIGCGNGAIGLYVKSIYPDISVWGVESHVSSLRDAEANALALGYSCDYMHSSKLDLALSQRADIVVNDVSGISSEIARITDWFVNATAPEDVDGLAASLRVFDQIGKFCSSSRPKIYFPIISLCNRDKYLDLLSEKYKLAVHSKESWPAPPALQSKEASDILVSLKEKNIIDYSLKFGALILHTEVWRACLK
jgi:hypothetical protein